jgi:hypothetical protein
MPAQKNPNLKIHSTIEAKPQKYYPYFKQRMDMLQCSAEENIIDLWQFDAEQHKNVKVQLPIFIGTERGIDIRVFGIDKIQIKHKSQGSRWSKGYFITRLQDPTTDANGNVKKYDLPKGAGTFPFFPPSLCNSYEAKEKIHTLYITEGYFKAFKAHLAGLHCVGLSSITHMRDKETEKLHTDILALIEACQVERVIWLVDGDFNQLSTKAIEAGTDVGTRPNGFWSSAKTFYDLLSQHSNLQKYFAYINTYSLEGQPKGLDDLLITYQDKTAEIVKEATDFTALKSTNENGKFSKRINGTYFTIIDISSDPTKVWRHMRLNDATEFYLYHLENYPALANKDFIFNGTSYRYDTKEGKCEIKIPKDAKKYFRVGDDYFEHLEIPDQFGNLQKTYHRRSKETIKDDYGKYIFEYIPKYLAFCNIPDHITYKPTVNNCYNIYHPFTHAPERGTWRTTQAFLIHLFGTDLHTFITDDGTEVKIKRYKLILDYLTILYKHPQRILPILCLVSEDRSTGKTTFADWLKDIFTQNMAIVGNDDLGSQFNSHWANKLIIATDETKIDKQVVLERVKGLSTAKTLQKNAKGKDQQETSFFGKFIFLSNNVKDFINITKDEIRFWVHEIKAIDPRNKNINMAAELKEEIPAVLYYLYNRKLLTPFRERHHFETKLLRTNALDNIIKHSKPSLEKTINNYITNLFENIPNLEVIEMSYYAIKNDICTKDREDYVKDTLKRMGLKMQNMPKRIKWPRLLELTKDSVTQLDVTWINSGNPARYYTFQRDNFIHDSSDIMQSFPLEVAAPDQTTDLPF